jgi:GTPase Era involved in 16S rRNA processing
VDTPGVLENPAYKLQQGMMDAVVGAFHDADVLLVVTDLFSTPIPNDSLFAKVQASNKPVIVAINKIDLASAVNPKGADKQATAAVAAENVEKTFTVQEAVARWRTLLPNAMAIIPMSASSTASSKTSFVSEDSDGDTNDTAPSNQDAGVQALRRLLTGGPNLPQALRNLGRPIPGMFRENSITPVGTFITDDEARELLPISPPLYDQEILTDRPERFIASELIRAALFGTLTKELPYCCEVRIQSFKEPKTIDDTDEGSGSKKKSKKPVIRIEADVLVERDSQKKIVIGHNAEMIK